RAAVGANRERESSRRLEESDVAIPDLRVRGLRLQPELRAPEPEAGADSPDAALRHEGEAWFRVGGSLEKVTTGFYDRTALQPGNVLEGPAIVNQYDSTTSIPPGLTARSVRFSTL